MSIHGELRKSALQIIKAQKTQDIPIGVLFDKFEALATPFAVLALIAEVEALRKDAERYRWLMSDAVMNGTLGIFGGWIDFEFKDEASKQIDEAMQEVKP